MTENIYYCFNFEPEKDFGSFKKNQIQKLRLFDT
jgi:hypothetical protein